MRLTGEVLTATSMSRIHHVDPSNNLIVSRHGEVFRGPPDALEREGRFPKEWGDGVRSGSLASRVLRRDRCVVHPLTGRSLIGIRGGSIGIFRDAEWHPLGRMSGRAPLHSRLATDDQGWTYVPEWWSNASRRSVRLWRVSPQASCMEVAHEWPAGSIRHLHTVIVDPYEPGVLWASSGDRDGECYLWRTADRFRSVERLGDGTQSCRAVFLWFTADRVGWLTDTEKQPNHVQWMSRTQGILERGQPLPGPVWHGARLREGGWIATTTVEVGPGVGSTSAFVLVSLDGERWEVQAELRKDGWVPHRWFGHGLVQLPGGEMSSDRVWMDASGLVERSGVFAMDVTGLVAENG